jgi:hypothetical protein
MIRDYCLRNENKEVNDEKNRIILQMRGSTPSLLVENVYCKTECLAGIG